MASSRPSHRGPDKIFGIPKHHSDSQHPGGRSYDYTQKYLPDELGKEADHEARIWKVYLDEAESYDEDMVRGFRDTIDSLLVLAGLFSAVVASFVVQTSLNLKPDYAQLTVVLLSEQVALLRAAGVGSSSTIVPATGVSAATATYNTFDVWINGLFFTSLSLGMFTALLAVLSKQWLQAYIALTSGSAKDRALARQFRFNGLQRWRLEHVVGFLPLILHAAFGVFFLGLCIFVPLGYRIR
ncbi:hypothetical protein DL96DRAFT_1697462 [Flagelloscypha sp. PMI_526]|nr:hypothetical protein DL96DRAFT_1697462 [Flagelloscypha sp. PMI_526]